MDTHVGMTQDTVADLRRTVLMAQAVQRDEPGDWSEEMRIRLQQCKTEAEFDAVYAESERPVAEAIDWDLPPEHVSFIADHDQYMASLSEPDEEGIYFDEDTFTWRGRD